MNCYLNLPMGSGRGPFSLHELDQVYLEVAGSTAWTQALLSVREDDMDWIRNAGEVVDEVLMQLSGRSGMERHLRLTHKRVNEARLQEARSESIAEQGIAWWRNRYHPKADQSQQPVTTPAARGAQ